MMVPSFSPPEPSNRPLSAWERRRLYSNQLREKTMLRTPELSRANGTTPTSSNKPGRRKSSCPASRRKSPKAAQSLAARSQHARNLMSIMKPKASSQSVRAKAASAVHVAPPSSKRAEALTCKPTAATKVHDKKCAPTKFLPPKRKPSVEVSLAQRKVELVRTALTHTKVVKASQAVEAQKRSRPQVKVCRQSVKTLSDKTPRGPSGSKLKKRAACDEMAKTGSSSSTPSCSVMVEKVALSELADSSSGSTPYHTAHSICLSSDDSVSPVGKRKLTPLHSSSPVKTPDQTPATELNDTFTLESPKKRSSKKPPSSCLRKGTSCVKKSVSFTMPARQSGTPKRLPKTPRRSRTLQESLKEWLKARGYSLSALRQSHGHNAQHQLGLTPFKAVRRTALRSAENQALGTSPVLQKPSRHSLQQTSESDEASKHTSIADLLTDLQQCLNQPNPPEDAETLLNQLEEHVPSVTDYPAYWICRCVCYEKAGDSAEAVKSLTLGLDFVATGRNQLTEALDSLMNKAPVATRSSPTRKQEHKLSRKPNLEHVSTENVFASTIIDYKVYEKPSLNQIHGRQCTSSVAVMTPVRRSSRNSKRRSNLISSPHTLLYKPNSALEDV
uniref:Protein ovary overexpressed n=1 Tax=Rhipicephalus microplus TaxID=6941 RepID=A0A6M2CUT5_RHIMP